MLQKNSMLDHGSVQRTDYGANHDWLFLLNQLSRNINLASEDIHETLRALMKRLIEEMHIDAIAIWTIEKSTNMMMIYSSAGLSDRYVRFFNKTDRIHVGRGLVGKVMGNRASMAMDNLSDYAQIGIPRWSKMLEEEGIVSALSVPMFVGGKIIGTFNIYHKEQHHYSEQEEIFTEILANQVAITLENVESSTVIKTDSKRYRKQIDGLLSIQEVVQTLNLYLYTAIDTSIKYLARYIENAFLGKGLAILRKTAGADALELFGSHNISEEHRQYMYGQKNFSDTAFIGSLLTEKKPQYSTRVFTDSRIGKHWATILAKEHYISVAAFPLLAHEQVTGMFLVYYDHLHQFSNEEISILNTFSQFLAVALENIKVFRSLEAEKQKTQSMVHSLRDGLIVYDLEGLIIDINPRGEVLLGISKDDVLNKKALSLDKDGGHLKNLVAVSKALVGDLETKEVGISGLSATTALEVTQVPLKGEGDRKIGSMRILHDITAEKAVERLQSSFVSTASHQLRTPLTGIKWGLDDLEREEMGPLNTEQKELMKKIVATNENMISLLNDLLDVSRIEEGRFEYTFEKGSLAELIERIVKDSEINVKERKLNVRVKKGDNLPQASFDKEKLQIALRNIIDNAIQYTYPGGTIEVKIDAGSEFLFITISDTGIGIPKDEMPFIFHKFFRARNAVLTRTEGSGLGLYISKSIISNHNGKVTFESKENKGTTFLVGLPIKEEFMPKGKRQEATMLS